MQTWSRVMISVIVCAIAVLMIPSCNLMKLFPRTVEVDATAEWFASGVDVEDGDELRIVADGVISINETVPAVGPDGTDEYGPADSTYPLPGESIGALVAKVGATGDVFLVGSELTFIAPADGELYFTVNDRPVDNNGGEFDVTIEFLGGLFE